MKPKSKACAIVAMLFPTLLLIGCATNSSAPRASLQLYQPRSLQLQAGRLIQTKAGFYVPQVDEVWHSAAAYEDLENQLINIAAALSQRRNTTP